MHIIEYKGLKDRFFACDKKLAIKSVQTIIEDVRKYGDKAVTKYTKEFDRVVLNQIRVGAGEIKRAFQKVDPGLLNALNTAKLNIERFSRYQLRQLKDFKVRIIPGVVAEQHVIPINRIGIYVPGGRFPLVSTVLMCGVPAKIAGVKEIVLCSPPSFNNSIHPAILATARLIGISEIYRIGGAQAIAALAYGTETIWRVDKIVGPGNVYVTMAKKYAYGDAGIDFIAGPSEILIIADDTAEPGIIAADLLSQAEHDIEAIPVLVTTSHRLAQSVNIEVEKQLKRLKTSEIANKSLNKNGLIILVRNLEQAIEFANKKAPEHLELQVRNPGRYINQLRNYGSLFIGPYSAEVLGDYCAGINHTLPTGGSARYTGGLHIKDFLKLQTVLKVNKKGFKKISPIAEQLAQLEGLSGHLNSILIRHI